MKHEETYHGHRIIVTTLQQGKGWMSQAALPDSALVPMPENSGKRYPSEKEARQAALSKAMEAIDRARTSKGKP